MHSSKHSEAAFPLWLICLLLFTLLTIFFFIRIPMLLKSGPSELSRSTPAQQQVLPLDVQEGPDDEAHDVAVNDTVSVMQSSEVPEDGVIDDVSPALVSAETPAPTNGLHIHRYHNGVCSECGASPEFITGLLPDEFYQEAEHRGAVVSYNYDVTAYANFGEGIYHKSLNIYLPYGYDDSTPYNVLVLLPGGGGDQNSWLNTVYDYGDVQMCGRVIFDNMIEKGLCEPCIIVTPVSETNLVQGLTASINQMRDELRNDILPYIVENYSTYAKDGSYESLCAARDHFALGGVSNGALFTFEGGMRYNFELFGSYCAFSGNGEPWKTLSIINQEKYASLPINCFFAGAGTRNDWQQYYTEIGFNYLVENDVRLTEGKNAWRVDVEGEHEWKVWFTDIYNALPLMFQSIG